MATDSSRVFSRWRTAFWPVGRSELRKFLPMFFMLFLICFNYSVIRNLKDALVVTAKSSGAEVIPFIKVWCMLPGAILGTILYTRLSARISQEKVFYIIVSAFVAYFLLFVFVLYPYRESLHPEQSADYLQQVLPAGFKWFIAMYRHWSFTLFYVVSELWACMVLNVLFWGFANLVTSLSEAKRFYAMFHVGSNLGTITASQTSVFFGESKAQSVALYGGDVWGETLSSLLLLVAFAAIMVMLLFRWVNKNVTLDPWVRQDPSERADQAIGSSPKRRSKGSLRDSFAYLATSNYLICVAIVVISYNLVINLVEVVWKDRLRNLCSDPASFNIYINYVTLMMGIISTVLALCMSWIVRHKGWRFTAMITPVVLFLTSLGFFTFFFLEDSLGTTVALLMGTSPLAITVFFGAAQNCFSKACKYSVFDATKEMSFIPLSHETKLKGKAAIDGVGSRIGKSGGSLIHQAFLMFFTTLTASAPYVACFLFLVIAAWMVAVRSLGKQFMAITSDHTGVKPAAPVKESASPAIA